MLGFFKKKPAAPAVDLTTAPGIDPLLGAAADAVIDAGVGSVSLLQRKMKLGYSRAAELIDQLEEAGIVGPFREDRPRTVLVSKVEALPLLQDVAAAAAAEPAPTTGVDDLTLVDLMDGQEFERWCAALLRQNGYTDVELTTVSGDQGVDILAQKDGIRFAIQCKCYSSDIGNSPVQEVTTGKVIYRCQIGAVMTNRYFTAGAKTAAEATGTLLWDRDKLREMMKV